MAIWSWKSRDLPSRGGQRGPHRRCGRDAEMPVKHATASAYVFGRFPTGWRLGLVEHPRLGRWMIPGGHVEHHESQAQAVLREVKEETGLTVRPLGGASSPAAG
ncbi:MAG: NUDIX domain-containing protein [Streptosporangiales bacterium]|nr:NUDIX domain-containing protein [Streptosporangiales bacterium]